MKVLAIFFVLGLGTVAFGLKCWTCDKAVTNDACNVAGSVQTCKPNEACVNQETTSSDGSRYQITKGCRRKNDRACKVSDPQNAGSYPTTCRFASKSSVCTCCCSTDMCNGPQTECKDAISCRKPDNPGNGRVRCRKGISYGSKCFITCNPGYTRVGPRFITCTNGTDQGYWSPRETSACIASSGQPKDARVTKCKTMMQTPEHGNMVCENKGDAEGKTSYNHVGTVCAFKCDSGYFMSGSQNAQCLPGGRWNIEAPECKKGKCQLPRRDKRRVDTCSDEYYVGSTCTMQCRAGYRLVGASSVTCNSINERIRQGAWSEDFPECVRAICRPQLMKPTNGDMTCTKKNLLGSVCSFSCDEGYELTDLSMTIRGTVQCVESGQDVEWNGVPPTCTRITCPRLPMPENGNLACVGDGSVGSKCIFQCNVGFDLIGTSEPTITTECTNDANGDGIGVWTEEFVTCERVQCRPERTAPLNGAVYCTNGNFKGSVCTFTCNDGYDMDDTTARLLINICEDDSAGDGTGKWSADPPTCSTRYYCDQTQTGPEHGTVACDNESYMGSICQFACDDGYELQGVDRITCRDLKNDGDAEVEWSSPAPTCVPSTCPAQWYDGDNIIANCNRAIENNVYPVGTKCTYECSKEGYYLDGDADVAEITCTAKNTWSASSAPRCFITTCPQLEKIENGAQPECTNGNRYQSKCRYRCNARYSPTHNDPVTCESHGRNEKVGTWDREPPQCVLNECAAVPPTPGKGTVECSSEARLGSYCTLECERGYAPRIARVDCQRQSKELNGELIDIPEFTHSKDFCCAQCRSEFNIVLAVDARFSQSLQSAIDFTKIFLSQAAAQDNPTSFSAFAYNVEVYSSLIERFEVSAADLLSEVFNQMEQWEIEEEGLTSDARAAIEFAISSVFAGMNPNQANFLIIAADDAPENVNQQLLQRLDQQGIHIIISAANQFSRLSWEKLLSEDNVVNQDSNEVFNRIYDLAFQNGCSATAPQCV